MRVRFIYIFLILALSTLASCADKIEKDPLPGLEISPSVEMRGASLPPYATKALVNTQSTSSISANFLRLDEHINSDNSPSGTFATWEQAYVLEGNIASPNSDNKRSAYLNPVQSYKYNNDIFYKTRIVSWYPMSCVLHKNAQGAAAITQLDYYQEKNGQIEAFEKNGENISIKFHDLNGEKDIMMSNVREGSYQGTPGPFGSNNTLKYKHYLSAVRIYAYTENSEQSYKLWGKLSKTYIREQPSICSIQIPEYNSSDENTFGSCTFEGKTTFELLKTPIYGNDNTDPDNIYATESPDLLGTSSSNPIYLGYALIAPGYNLVMDVHAETGVFSVEVNKKQNIKGQDIEIFQPGYIYDIKLNFNTDGSISGLLLQDGENRYYDLTQIDPTSGLYKTANCYIVNPKTYNISGTEYYYDGFAFLADQIGNGDFGLHQSFPHKTSHIDPVRAGLIWESSKDLVTQIELIYNYVRFKINLDKNGDGTPGDYTEGNAVIGVFDKAGKIIWSWHIWITDDPVEHTITVGSNDINILDRNLGALFGGTPSTESETLESYGLYYQWGRKDPSMTPESIDYSPLSTTTAPYWDYFGDEYNSAMTIFKGEPTIMDGVEKPMYIILPSDIPHNQYDWISETNDKLWTDTSRPIVAKTIYDPCPFGYRVPQQELSTFLANSTPTAKNNGITVSDKGGHTIFFPSAGYKGVDRGISSLTAAWKYVGKKGDYMSSLIHENGHRQRTYINPSGTAWRETGADSNHDGFGDSEAYYPPRIITTDYANRRTAASVRCVKTNEASQLGSIFVKLTGPMWVYYEEGKTLSLNYNVSSIHSSINNVSITKTIGANAPVTENIPLTPTQHISGTYSHTLDNPNGRYYRITASNEKGIADHETLPVNVVTFADIKIGSQSYNTGTYDLGLHNVSFQLNGVIEDLTGYEVHINGVTATKNDNRYSVVGAFISGNIHIAIEADGKIVLSKDFPVDMSGNSQKITKGSQVENASDLQHGKAYIITASTHSYWGNTYCDSYYWTKNDNNLDFSNKSIGINNIFVWHTDHSVLGNCNSSYLSKNSGAWMTPDMQNGLTENFTFSSTPHLFIIGNHWYTDTPSDSALYDDMDIYRSNGNDFLYFDPYGTSTTNGFRMGASHNGRYKWRIYEVSFSNP